MKLSDKMLPGQPKNNQLFVGSDFYFRLFEVICASSEIKPADQEFKLTLSDRVSVEDMASNPIQLRLLELLVKILRPQAILEIGAFIGISAMTMARALPPGGKLYTIEKFEHFADICRKNFRDNNLDQRIELINGDAMDVLDALLVTTSKIDMVFIDGNKENYADYFMKVAPHVRPGGLVLVDDVFFHGDVVNAMASTEKGRGCWEFMQLAKEEHGWCKLALPICNGLMIMMKRDTA